MESKKVGVAYLPLHWGRAPPWLFQRMVRLGRLIVKVVLDEFGEKEFLRRLSDPCWFQAFSCVLGWDFHSSGCTTVTTAVLKEISVKEELGFKVAGGKGRVSRKTPEEIVLAGEQLGLSEKKIEKLTYASRMAAKVDNVAIQAGYPLYHHAIIFTEEGDFAVIQQGMNTEDRTARRYHWISERIKSFVDEPHAAICCDVKREGVLNMVAKESREARELLVDLVKEGPRRIYRDLVALRDFPQKTLLEFAKEKKLVEEPQKSIPQRLKLLIMPESVNWKALERAYNLQVENFEGLLRVEGIGPKTVRSLALISELIYGKEVSWRDPKRYSFCVGGKDGVPYRVRKKHYDEIIKVLEEFVKKAELGKKDELMALKRLANFKEECERRLEG